MKKPKQSSGQYACEPLAKYNRIADKLSEMMETDQVEGRMQFLSGILKIQLAKELVKKSPTPPQYVLWYHNSKMINYDTTRGGVQVRTEQGQKTESHLTIHEAKDSDSGNYTCSASNTQPAYIHVFVSD
ncbi:uncharacterized protein, partial [Halyomorpha halys]|uniref:uncharacterized protein n=1 Tax=Halyomorpha halys TaxID=286706 RepID=UPI0006D51287